MAKALRAATPHATLNHLGGSAELTQTLRHFTRPDELHFQAAVGWLELGNWLEANKEPESITP